MIELHGPYRKRKRIDDLYNTVIFILFLAVLALGCFAFLRACVQYRHAAEVQYPSYMTPKEGKRLQRYHGTEALRFQRGEVAIWRGEKWVRVRSGDGKP